MSNDYIYLDQAGYDNLLMKINDLIGEINQIGKQNHQASSSDSGEGWLDNFDFEESVRQERQLKFQLSQYQSLLKRVRLIDNVSEDSIVDFEDIVEVTINSLPINIKLVGKLALENTNDDVLEISTNSPLGKSIYHQRVGSHVTYSVDDDIYHVEIINLSKNMKKTK